MPKKKRPLSRDGVCRGCDCYVPGVWRICGICGEADDELMALARETVLGICIPLGIAEEIRESEIQARAAFASPEPDWKCVVKRAINVLCQDRFLMPNGLTPDDKDPLLWLSVTGRRRLKRSKHSRI